MPELFEWTCPRHRNTWISCVTFWTKTIDVYMVIRFSGGPKIQIPKNHLLNNQIRLWWIFGPSYWPCYIAVLITDVFDTTCGTQTSTDLCPRNHLFCWDCGVFRERNAHSFSDFSFQSLLTMWDQKSHFFRFCVFTQRDATRCHRWKAAALQLAETGVDTQTFWFSIVGMSDYFILVFNIFCCKINTIIHHFLLIFWLMISETQNFHRVCA